MAIGCVAFRRKMPVHFVSANHSAGSRAGWQKTKAIAPAVISKNSIYFMIYLNFISFGFLPDCIASSGSFRSMKLKLISGISSASANKINTKPPDRQSNILYTINPKFSLDPHCSGWL